MAHSSLLPPAPGTIFLVDDEVELVEAVGGMLRTEFGALRVRATSDPREALAWVRQEKPSVLITDVQMPDLSGLELLERTQALWGPIPTVIITAYPAELVAHASPGRSPMYLPKPFSFRSLVNAIAQVERMRPASFRGAVTVSTMADLLQLYSLSGSTGLMTVRSQDRAGEIWFEHGQVVHAYSENHVGFEAFCDMVRWPGGSFTWKARRTTEHSIQISVSALLLEAYRLEDEAQRDVQADSPPAPEGAAPASSRPPRRDSSHRSLSVPIGPPRSSFPPAPPRPGSPLPPAPPRPAQDPYAGQLRRLRHVEGFLGAALVDSESGLTLGVIGGSATLNLETAAAANTEVVRANRQVIAGLDLRDEIEDILITLSTQYHLIRPLRARPSVFFYLALDRGRANLALARMTLADAEYALGLLPGPHL